ncbi:hypothetical protein WEI85_14550 [Actinomycetes bacterium KLBMP 9797]
MERRRRRLRRDPAEATTAEVLDPEPIPTPSPPPHPPSSQPPSPPSSPPSSPAAPARPSAPGDERETERGLRGLVGSGSSQVGTSAAMRARDAARPTETDLAEAEQRLVIVRRNWVPRD